MVHGCFSEPINSINQYKCIVGVVTADASDHGLRVLLIACYVDEGEHFGGTLDDLGPGEGTEFVGVCYYLPLRVKTQDLLGD